MSERSKIEWTDATWPVVTGCTKVSAGCNNCYAIRDSRRLGANPNPKVSGAYAGTAAMENGRLNWTGVVRCLPQRLNWPLKWKKPRRIFVCNESDLFHEAVPDEFICQVLNRCYLTKQHIYQVLTKRPQRMFKFLMQNSCINKWPNLWLGVSVENQKTADERIPLLLQTPAAVRFVSYEPALGPVDFTAIDFVEHPKETALRAVKQSNLDVPPDGDFPKGVTKYNTLSGDWFDGWDRGSDGNKLDWVIAGGESGPGARPPHPDWFRSVRDQCRDASVPFFFKQWGEFVPGERGNCPHPSSDGAESPVAKLGRWPVIWKCSICGRPHGRQDNNSVPFDLYSVGKKAAGRLLDGREWDEFPK